MIAHGAITSTREVYNELEGRGDELSDWCKANRSIFQTPTPPELEGVRKVFAIPHFQAIIRKKERLEGKPVADPFVVARAMLLEGGCVVTNEKHTPNAAKLPNVCETFKIECIDLEGFMERENWRF
jgi:hypothetical protein